MALKSLQASKTRSILTMLGIIIGVASVIILVSLMNGLSSDITSNLESAGTNTITATVMGRGGNRSFSNEDMEAFVEENPDFFVAVSPSVSAQVSLKNGTVSLSTTATGVNEYYNAIRGLELEAGRFIQYIDVERLQRVCVIGSHIASELFDGAVYDGAALKLNGASYTVVGVLEETANSVQGSSDDVIYIPYTAAARIAGGAGGATWYIQAKDPSEMEAAISLVENKLYSAFGDEDAYRVFSMSQMIEMMNEITGSISLVLVGIAGISLVVGGIGIMNIMLVSVTERTREIGIRKALGARRRAVMSQFIIEAAATSAAGGVIGIIAGIGLAFLSGRILEMTVAPSAGAILVAFGVSVAIGVVFGCFPAGKAAKLNPVDALRHE
jgi:putative ABC transport system permease protein